MGKMTKAVLAVTGESLSVCLLERLGHRIIQRNYHSAYGELDIISLDGEELVFTEVKTRTGISAQTAENCVSIAKRKKLTLTAAQFLADHEHYSDKTCRFDVIIAHYDAAAESFGLRRMENAFLPAKID
jgi:putative endonuclease